MQQQEEERQRRIAEQQNKERPALETHHPMETLSVNYDAAHPANKWQTWGQATLNFFYQCNLLFIISLLSCKLITL